MKYLLLLPALVFCALFVLWPLGELVRISLMKTDYIASEWAGLKNYARIFRDADFLRSVANSVWYVLLLVPLTTGTALVVSLYVTDLSKGWIDATRIVFFIPSLSAGIIIAQAWRWIYHTEGPLNWLLGLLGAGPVFWMNSGATAIPAISLVVAMAGWGGGIIIFLAAILSIDRELYDAAIVDGASPMQIKIRIVVPMILPMIAAMALLAAIAAPQIFETVYALAPYNHSITLGYRIYQEAFHMSRHGTAAAMSMMLLFAMVGLAWLKTRVAK